MPAGDLNIPTLRISHSDYQLIRSRRRSLSLEITHDARLVIRAPERLALRKIEHFVDQKRNWIVSRQEAARKRAAERPRRTFTEGEMHLFLGRSYPIRFVQAGPTVCLDGALNLRYEFAAHAKKVLAGWYREQAAAILPERLRAAAQRRGIRYRDMKLSNAKARWGSCAPDGTIRLNWRLVMAPPEVIDYVAAHELAHIKIKNHRRRFWEEVGRLCPEYARHVRWLKEHQPVLSL